MGGDLSSSKIFHGENLWKKQNFSDDFRELRQNNNSHQLLGKYNDKEVY